MGDPKGFLKSRRQTSEYRPVCERIEDYKQVNIMKTDETSREQALRCMDCGTPFCHWGCPVCNLIPEWNDLMYNGKWKEAVELLQKTNNLPEITGRLCPATCESACVLGLNDDPITIRENELAIIEHAFSNNWIKPNPPKKRTGKSVAVVGSGPAGLACADQLNKAGHKVTVFEKSPQVGGILRYGIPDFKLEKHIIDRRVNIYKKEGMGFKTNVNVGFDYSVSNYPMLQNMVFCNKKPIPAGTIDSCRHSCLRLELSCFNSCCYISYRKCNKRGQSNLIHQSSCLPPST